MGASDLDNRESEFDLKGESEFVIFRPNHQLMSRPERREQDGKLQRIFFYQRVTDNKIFAFTEAEAARLRRSSHNVILRQLGVSDGRTYAQFINNCGLKAGEKVSKKKAEEILKGAFDAELKAATGKFANPLDQNVHFDNSFPLNQRDSFVPPA